MTLRVSILSRASNIPFLTLSNDDPRLPKAQSYSFNAIGGPRAATLLVKADRYTLMNYLGSLRNPVQIFDELGAKVWWGYIHEVQIKVGSVSIGASLDTMTNHVRVTYNLVTPGDYSKQDPVEKYTPMVEDLDSIGEYGYKESVQDIGDASSLQANNKAGIFLNQRKYPIPIITQANPADSDGATILCRGWWETLGWRYYSRYDGLYSYTNGGGGKATVGDYPDSKKVAQLFQIPGMVLGWNAVSVKIRVMKTGAPVDNFRMRLYDSTVGGYSAKHPNNLLATATSVGGADVPTELDWVEWLFDTPPALAVLTDYWLELDRDGGNDPDNYYWAELDTGCAPKTGFKEYNAGSGLWVTRIKVNDGHLVMQICDSIETTQQAYDAVIAKGQFLTGADIIDASGVYSCQYRDGNRTTLEEILDLMMAGTVSGKRLLSGWSVEGRPYFYEEPDKSNPAYILKKDGSLVNLNNVPIPNYMCPAGCWVRVDDTVDWDTGFMADPTRLFVEEAEYNVEGDSLAFTPRDMQNPLDVFVLKGKWV